MSIVCSICGGTHVTCAAVVDPNTKIFIEFGYEAFLDGQCEDCHNVILTNPQSVQCDIGDRLQDYYKNNTEQPRYALCEYVDTENYEGSHKGYVQLFHGDIPEIRPHIIACCNGVEELKTMTIPMFERGFTVIGCHNFTKTV